MEIKNVSIVTLDEITNTTTQPFNKANKTVWISFAIIVICSSMMIFTGDVVWGSIFLGVGILFPVFMALLRKFLVKKIRKANAMLGGSIYYEYIFGDEFFSVSTVAGENKSIDKIYYSNLIKAQLIGELIFLFISMNNAYIVKKSGFETPQDCLDFLEFLKSKQKP